MQSIEGGECSFSAVVRSYRSCTIAWPVMNAAAARDINIE